MRRASRPGLRDELAGIAAAVAAAVVFGTLAIFAKYAYRHGADPIPLLAVRFVIAVLLLWGWQAVGRRRGIGPHPIASHRTIGKLVLLGALGYGLESAMFFAALERAPAGVVALLFYSYPLWTTLIGFATGLEPFRWQLLMALVFGLAGVSLVLSITVGGGLAGALLAMAAAVAVAVYLTAATVAARDVPATASALWTAAGAALSLLIAAIATGTGLPLPALPFAAALGAATPLAFILLFTALSRIGSSRSAVAAMFEPVTTVALAAWLLGEVLTVRVVIGAVLVLSALPVLALAGRRRGASPGPM